MTSKLLIANWKMYGDKDAINVWIKHLKAHNHSVVLCLQSLLLDYGIHFLSEHKGSSENQLRIGAQDCHHIDEGPYTGFISPKLLSHMGCDAVIVGHSERRHFESDELIHKKVCAALSHNIMPIICVGEPLDIREKGNPIDYVMKQLSIILPKDILRDATDQKNLSSVCSDHTQSDAQINTSAATHAAVIGKPYFCIAYEPLWAIGTGKIPTLDDIDAMHTAIKNFINNNPAIAVLYGGSVKSDNASTIMNLLSVDGLLVGGASLQIDDFNKICNA